MAVVYIHRRETDGQPFYVGVGKSKNRATHISNRTDFWKRIYRKYGRTIDIVKTKMSYKDAEELEGVLIDWYGRLDKGTGILCNMTSGGNSGSLGRPMSEYNKIKLSKRVAKYTLLGVKIKEYDSIKDAAIDSGANRTNISICANPNNNRKTTSGGFKWKYI